MSYLKKRGRRFHFQKRVPKKYQDFFFKKFIQVSLNTDSEVIALQRAHNLNRFLIEFWKELPRSDEKKKSEEHFLKMITHGKLHDFEFTSQKDLIETQSLPAFLNRVNLADAVDDKKIKEAVLNGTQESSITISKSLNFFLEHERVNLKGLSEDQIRKWKNPRRAAIENFIEVIGDKNLYEITREDVLNFRSWWVDRIEEENLSANSANKQFGFVKKILATTIDNKSLKIPTDDLFKKIILKEVEKIKRYPFTSSFIQKILLNSDKIKLNREAHLLMYAMCDTGARPGELVGLEDEDIVLDCDIPHIKIRPNDTRALKTPQSERDIPLVGTSFYAFKELNGSFRRYQGKSDLISATINKYCRENNIYPSKNYTLYSFRHSFEDRLTAVEPPEKVQAALMGHKYQRPRYGLGPSLEQKRTWLSKIAFKV